VQLFVVRIEFCSREKRRCGRNDEELPMSRLCDGRGKSFNQYLND